jgi:hypothetical protein
MLKMELIRAREATVALAQYVAFGHLASSHNNSTVQKLAMHNFGFIAGHARRELFPARLKTRSAVCGFRIQLYLSTHIK